MKSFKFFICFFLTILSLVLPLAAQPHITRFASLRSFDEKSSAKEKRFLSDNVFFDGTVDKEAPWIERKLKRDKSGRGKVASFRYNVDVGYVGYYVRLIQGRRFQYNHYNALQFWVKGDLDELKVELKDTSTHAYTVRNVTSEWRKVLIPLDEFTRSRAFDFKRLSELVFVVSSDGNTRKQGSFVIDDIAFVYYKEKKLRVKIKSFDLFLNDTEVSESQIFANTNITLRAHFRARNTLNKTHARFEASGADGVWFLVDQQPITAYEVTGMWDARYFPSGEYRLRLRIVQGEQVLYTSKEFTLSLLNSANSQDFLMKLLKDTYQYFHNEHQPKTYLTKDRNGQSNVISTGATGFALSVYPLAAERGFITHDEAMKRINAILETYLTKVKHHRGFYQHWFDFDYNPVFEPEGIDSVETSYLAAGALFCSRYYQGDDERERMIRTKAKQLINRINWSFMLGPDGKKEGAPIQWLYTKESKEFRHPVIGFNECLITYIMARVSPRAIPLKSFKNWYGDYSYKYYLGEKVIFYPTLFTQHYSFMYIDPRTLRDRWVNYFENAQRATLINREYAIRETDAREWGLTACDGPKGYSAYGVDVPFAQSHHDGTISPSASIGSLPFTPYPVLANMQRMYERFESLSYGPYGFYDSFNSKQHWSSRSYLGITQGTIYLQIENYLDERVWKTFMSDGRIQTALRQARFKFELPDTQ